MPEPWRCEANDKSQDICQRDDDDDSGDDDHDNDDDDNVENHYDDCSSDQRYIMSMNMNMMMIMMKITLVSVPKSDDDNCQSRIKYCIQDYDEVMMKMTNDKVAV